MPSKLDGKVALITGASSGIGEATALSLASKGARVAIVARRSDRLEAVSKKIEGLEGVSHSISGDLSKYEDCQRAIAETVDEFGGIDILVNNAGVMLLGPINGADISDWRRMVDINVLGLMYMTREALPHMIEAKSGHIVNISSVAGRVARSGAGVYNATKFGVGAFSESLRQEVSEHNVRVTVIEPGAVLTELTDHITHQESKDRLKSWVGSMTALTSEDIAESIVYAVSQPEHVNVNEVLIRPVEQSL